MSKSCPLDQTALNVWCQFDLSHLYRWRRGWCHLWHPDTDRGWHDVLINDGNQVLSLREVTHGWHHYVRTSDITAPAPALVTGIITRPDVIITWSLGNLHFISLTSVCSGARLPRLQDTNRKSFVICIKQHMQHFGEQFGVKCSEREGPLVTIHHGQPAAKFSKARPLQRALHEPLPGDLQQTNVAIQWL